MSRVMMLRIVVLAAFIGLLELLTRTNVITPFTMVAPSTMVTHMVIALADAVYQREILGTLRAIGIAMVASITVGLAVGVLLHASPRARRTVDPALVTYYSVPVFVFYPLFIVLFGLTDTPKIIIGFMYAVVAMIINTLNGLDRVPPVLIKTARVLRMGWLSRTVRIVIPAALPFVFTGVKLAIAYSFIGVIGSEFILSGGGLGYRISFAYYNFDTPTLYALILFTFALVITVNMTLYQWEKLLMKRRGRS